MRQNKRMESTSPLRGYAAHAGVLQEMKKSVKLTIALLAVMIVTVTVSAYIYHFRPLISSTDWTASMKIEGQDPVAGEVFHLLGRSDTLFIRFPAPMPEDSRGYPWFSANTSRKFVAIPDWPRTTPYLHFNHDKAIGVEITDGKVDDDWQSEWTEGEFSFSNPQRTVAVTRSNK